MNTLANYIQEHNLIGEPAEIVVALDSDIEIVGSSKISKADLAVAAGQELTGLTKLWLSLDTVDLRDAKQRAAIEAADVDAATIDKLLKINVRLEKRYVAAGFDTLPTDKEVEFALQQVAVAQWAASLQNEVISPMVASGESTIADIQAAVAAYKV